MKNVSEGLIENGFSKKNKKSEMGDKLRPYAYLSPALISIFVLTFLPILYTVYIAFTNYNMNHINDYTLVGFENFKYILTGPFKNIFLPVFGWTLAFAALSTLGTFFIGLLIAMMLNNPNMKEAPIYKAILVLPWALPATIAVLAWVGLYNTSYGGINIILQKLHIISQPIPWLTDATWARIGLLIANFWLGFPYMMNVCLGALSSIPSTYYEAADLDGASEWQKFIKITLPTITTTSLPLLIGTFAFNFNNFGSAYLITGGGPARLDTQFAGSTDILVSSAYKMSLTFNRYDLGAALSIVIFILIATVSLIQMKMTGAFKEVK